MNGKIALEEHWEPEDFDATGEHVFTKPDYFADVERRLVEVDERVKDMDRNGIGVSILSLTQPGIEGITDAMLSQRLKELEAEGLVSRAVGAARPIEVHYALTDIGAQLAPVLQAVGKWARRWAGNRELPKP